jgi:glycosyltransferase involved in cell wall biosynthesis
MTESSGELLVAINAQINPNKAGGVESSVLSIIDSFRTPRNGVTMKVIAAERYADEMIKITRRADQVIAWQFPERGPVTSQAEGRLATLRRCCGPGAPVFDALLRRYRLQRLAAQSSTAEDHDRILKREGVSVVHFGYPLKFATSLPYVYEPHDIQHRHYPDFFSRDEWIWREKVYKDGCKRSSFVVCGTYWTKQDIIRQFGLPTGQVAVIRRSSIKVREKLAEDRRREIAGELNLPDHFAFYPAMTFAHKNHIRLVQAIAELRDRHGVVLPLLCTGRIHKPHFPKVNSELNRLGLASQVRFLGPLPEESLAAVFQSAAFMVFPSLFEGLSQSLLEGLANGVPIVAASQSSIPETVGKAALLFDGRDVDSIKSALLSAVRDPERLAEITARAPAELARYAWGDAAVVLSACYKRATGRSLTPEETDALDNATRADGPSHTTGPAAQ